MDIERNLERKVFQVNGFELIVKTYMFLRDDGTLARTLYYDAEGVQRPQRCYAWFAEELENAQQEVENNSIDDNRELRKILRLIEEERNSWNRIEISSNVTEIEKRAFQNCREVQEVIFLEDDVHPSQLQYIWTEAFAGNLNLKKVKFPRVPRFEIGPMSFRNTGLESLFIPGNCVHCRSGAFLACYDLRVVHIDLGCRFRSPNFRFQRYAIFDSCDKLVTNKMKKAKFDPNRLVDEEVLDKHRVRRYAAFQLCCSDNVTIDAIMDKLREKGLKYFRVKDQFGVSPLDYLKANPYCDSALTEGKIMRHFVLASLGEIEK